MPTVRRTLNRTTPGNSSSTYLHTIATTTDKNCFKAFSRHHRNISAPYELTTSTFGRTRTDGRTRQFRARRPKNISGHRRSGFLHGNPRTRHARGGRTEWEIVVILHFQLPRFPRKVLVDTHGYLRFHVGIDYFFEDVLLELVIKTVFI